mmetsp:Transcript_101927/g.297238  ORF Transcript_101927/g.297238 Transcript_101927/m.297238 type:complete len:224 (-) Transcript_101927:548-1219(-)
MLSGRRRAIAAGERSERCGGRGCVLLESDQVATATAGITEVHVEHLDAHDTVQAVANRYIQSPWHHASRVFPQRQKQILIALLVVVIGHVLLQRHVIPAAVATIQCQKRLQSRQPGDNLQRGVKLDGNIANKIEQPGHGGNLSIQHQLLKHVVCLGPCRGVHGKAEQADESCNWQLVPQEGYCMRCVNARVAQSPHHGGHQVPEDHCQRPLVSPCKPESGCKQ